MIALSRRPYVTAVALGAVFGIMAFVPFAARMVAPAHARPVLRAVVAKVKPVAEPPAPPAPAALQEAIEKTSARFGHVGIAIRDIRNGWVAQVNGAELDPQQSVSKLWVAIAVLDAVDRGQLRLNQPVLMRRDDLSVFYQPIARKVGSMGYVTTVQELLERALTDSDNAANDKLIRLIGGPQPIVETMKRKGLWGVRVGDEERVLQSKMAGMTWQPEWAGNMGFREARAALPGNVRDAAMAAYLANPDDGATPLGMVSGLARLQRHEILSAQSSDLLLSIMADARTGKRRLKGGLPDDWTIAHKTGTGQDLRNYSVGINDVGVVTAPDGHAYAIAVMIPKTSRGVGARMDFMQHISEDLVAFWNAEHGVAGPVKARIAEEPRAVRGRHHGRHRHMRA
jgi:beta-lactamase class A